SVYELISIKKLIPAIKKKQNKNAGSTLASPILFPNQTVKSVLENPEAIAKPAPKISSTPQGKLLAAFQFIRASRDPLPAGIINKLRAPIIAIIVSSNFGNNFTHKKSFEIQRKATIAKTIRTLFSGVVMFPKSSNITDDFFSSGSTLNRVKYIQAKSKRNKLIGKAKSIQFKKVISICKDCFKIPAKIMLGGEPIKVAIPPIDSP